MDQVQDSWKASRARRTMQDIVRKADIQDMISFAWRLPGDSDWITWKAIVVAKGEDEGRPAQQVMYIEGAGSPKCAVWFPPEA